MTGFSRDDDALIEKWLTWSALFRLTLVRIQNNASHPLPPLVDSATAPNMAVINDCLTKLGPAARTLFDELGKLGDILEPMRFVPDAAPDDGDDDHRETSDFRHVIPDHLVAINADYAAIVALGKDLPGYDEDEAQCGTPWHHDSGDFSRYGITEAFHHVAAYLADLHWQRIKATFPPEIDVLD